MSSKEFWLTIVAIFAGLIFTAEFVGCQWHADNLEHGCATNAWSCANAHK
ncbi:MAG TPA: hypothetical protein VN660_13605 [Steroidobacteraceae bacterium]|nr:hypothetical protein [Steroidobacteraceae bacterium]